MRPIAVLLILYIAEVLLSPPKKERYRNVEAVLTAAVLCIVSTIAVLAVSLLQLQISYFDWIVAGVQTVALLGCKLAVKNRNGKSRHLVPPEYTTGRQSTFVSMFYRPNDIGPGLLMKDYAEYIGITALITAAGLYLIFLLQSAVLSGSAVLTPPATCGCLISLLLELGMFLTGTSALSERLGRYLRRKNCRTAREVAAARHALLDDYEYLFKDNYVSEHNHVIKATKQQYRPQNNMSGITFYDFKNKTHERYDPAEPNEALLRFLNSNKLAYNKLFCAAYDLIDKNKNVLLKTPSYADFQPYLAAMIKQKIAKTERIVVIVNATDNQHTVISTLQQSFADYFGFKAIPVFSTLENWFRETLNSRKETTAVPEPRRYIRTAQNDEPELPYKEPDVIIASPDDICDPLYTALIRSMASRLGMIVYYDFSDCVQEQPLFAKIVHAVLDIDDTVSTLYMTDGFCDLEQTMDNFFSTRAIYQISAPRDLPQTSYDMVWKNENSRTVQSREITDASRNFGTHIAILYYALGFIRNDAMMVADEYDTYAENLMNYHDDQVINRIDNHVGWTDVVGGESVFCTVSDTYNNIPHTYLCMRGIGRKREYINIISRPYLLRKYLAYNLKYFSSEPDVLTTFSSGIIRTPRAIATEAIVQAYILGCKAEKIKSYAHKLKIDLSLDPERMLQEIAAIAYDAPIEVVVTFDHTDGERYFVNENAYVTIMEKSEFITKMNFSVNGEIIRRPYRDYRYLIPHQKIVLNGRKYTVLSIKGDQVELTNSNNRDPVYATRTVRTCKAEIERTEGYGKIYQHGNDSHLDFVHMICNATVNVLGRISYTDTYSLLGETARYNFHEIGNVSPKIYNRVDVFKIRIGSSLINDGNRHQLAHIMALLFNEMMPTFFPKHHEKVMISCSGWNIDEDLRFDQVSPLHTVTAMDIDDQEPAKSDEICLYIMEDSAIETGLVNVFWQDEEFRYMLKILEDYLYYIEYVDRDERFVMFGKKYDDILHTLRKILLLVINEQVDGDITGRCLNSIRVTRNKFNNLDLTKKYVLKCDFCRKTIPYSPSMRNSYHFYHYSGMVSCPVCYRKAVCTENYSISEVGNIEARIHKWLSDRYGAVIAAPFYNYLEDAELITGQTSYANHFISTDDDEDFYINGISSTGKPYTGRLTVGSNSESIAITPMPTGDTEHAQYDTQRAAYKVIDEEYRYILIRDGLPRNEYGGVLCHEMTHQWQHDMLDPDAMTRNIPAAANDEFGNAVPIRDFRYEGHAMWAEVQYLRKIDRKLARAVEQSLAQRNDEYGFGYRWMCDLMKVGHTDPYTPTDTSDKEFMKKLRHFQFKKNAFGVMQLYFGKYDVDIGDAAEDDGIEELT